MDRLEEIKNVVYDNSNEADVWAHLLDDRNYLISELTKCRAENAEYNALFILQRTRSQKADKLWQKATGNYNIIPDLGVLLEWLGEEIKELEKRIDDWRGLCSTEQTTGMEWKDKAEKERRHRKRALHKLYKLRHTYKGQEKDIDYHYKKAEKLKVEVTELYEARDAWHDENKELKEEIERLRSISCAP